MDRRSFLTGMAIMIAAPYVVRDSGLLMPIADRSLVTYEIRGEKLAEGGGPLPEPDWLQTIRVPARRKVNPQRLIAAAMKVRPDVYWSGVIVLPA